MDTYSSHLYHLPENIDKENLVEEGFLRNFRDKVKNFKSKVYKSKYSSANRFKDGLILYNDKARMTARLAGALAGTLLYNKASGRNFYDDTMQGRLGSHLGRVGSAGIGMDLADLALQKYRDRKR